MNLVSNWTSDIQQEEQRDFSSHGDLWYQVKKNQLYIFFPPLQTFWSMATHCEHRGVGVLHKQSVRNGVNFFSHFTCQCVLSLWQCPLCPKIGGAQPRDGVLACYQATVSRIWSNPTHAVLMEQISCLYAVNKYVLIKDGLSHQYSTYSKAEVNAC